MIWGQIIEAALISDEVKFTMNASLCVTQHSMVSFHVLGMVFCMLSTAVTYFCFYMPGSTYKW